MTVIVSVEIAPILEMPWRWNDYEELNEQHEQAILEGGPCIPAKDCPYCRGEPNLALRHAALEAKGLRYYDHLLSFSLMFEEGISPERERHIEAYRKALRDNSPSPIPPEPNNRLLLLDELHSRVAKVGIADALRDFLSLDLCLDVPIDQDTPAIRTFVDRYGFGFIPYNSALNLRRGALPGYFTEFRNIQTEFKELWKQKDDTSRVARHDGLISKLLQGVVPSPKVREDPLYPKLNVTWGKSAMLSFIVQRTLEAQANNQSSPYSVKWCRYCDDWFTGRGESKYPQFFHCTKADCTRAAKNDIWKWRYKEDPEFGERQREQTRERVKRHRQRARVL